MKRLEDWFEKFDTVMDYVVCFIGPLLVIALIALAVMEL